MGDAYIAANQPLSAVVPYQQAVEGAATLSLQVTRREKLALAYQLAGQYSAALEQYDAISGRREDCALSCAHRVAIGPGAGGNGPKTTLPISVCARVMSSAPSSASAFAALQALVEAGQDGGRPAARASSTITTSAYPAAQQAFKRAIASGSDVNEVRYWAALNYVRVKTAPTMPSATLNENHQQRAGSSALC